MMDSITNELIKNYNWSVDFFNKGEYEQFWRNIRPTIEYLCKFIIADLSMNESEFKNLLDGHCSIELDKENNKYVINLKQTKIVKGKGLISLFPILFYAKNDYCILQTKDNCSEDERNIKNRIETYKKNLFHYYGIASEIGMHSGVSEYNETVSAISCASIIDEFLLFLSKKNILTEKSKQIITKLSKKTFNYIHENNLVSKGNEDKEKDLIIKQTEQELKDKIVDNKKLHEYIEELKKQIVVQKKELEEQNKTFENEKIASLNKIDELNKKNEELKNTIKEKELSNNKEKTTSQTLIVKTKNKGVDESIKNLTAEKEEFYKIYDKINSDFKNVPNVSRVKNISNPERDFMSSSYKDLTKNKKIKLIIFKLDNVLINTTGLSFFKSNLLDDISIGKYFFYDKKFFTNYEIEYIQSNYFCDCIVLSSFSRSVTKKLLNLASLSSLKKIITYEDVHNSPKQQINIFDSLLETAININIEKISRDNMMYIGCDNEDVMIAHKNGILSALYFNKMNRKIIDNNLSTDFIIRIYRDLWMILNDFDSRLLFMESSSQWKNQFTSGNFKSILKKDISGNSFTIFFAGRYFNKHSYANQFFQLREFSNEILLSKEKNVFSTKWFDALKTFIVNQLQISMIKHISVCLTCIPFRHNRPQRLECFLYTFYKYLSSKTINLDCEIHIMPDLLEFDNDAVSNHRDAKDRLSRFKNINDHLHVKHKDYLRRFQKIIIIDDVTTTGASLIVSSKKLTSLGAQEVILFAFAHAVL